MARKESDLVRSDSWQIDGLINNTHPMAGWIERRLKGRLTAELTEAVRQEVGTKVLGLDMADSAARESVRSYIDDEKNAAAVDAVRARLRGEAQAALDAGTYGTGQRGPVAVGMAAPKAVEMATPSEYRDRAWTEEYPAGNMAISAWVFGAEIVGASYRHKIVKKPKSYFAMHDTTPIFG